MNTGTVSSRYARALLRYVQETGGGERVCAQARELLREPEVLSRTRLEPELERLVGLLSRNGRMAEARTTLQVFIDMYCRSMGVMAGKLKTAVPAPGLAERLKPVLERQFGCKVELESETDPSLVGGFIIDLGGYRLDASTRHQIESIRKEFVMSANRIV